MKGYGGEREAIALLQPIIDGVCEELRVPRIELVRDSRQRFEKKHYDIFGLPWLCLEVKRVEQQGMIGSWWKQTMEACKPGQIPVLMYRPNFNPWRVRMRAPISVVKGGFIEGKGMHRPVRVRMTVTIDFADFQVWFRCMCKAHLSGNADPVE